MTGQDWMRLFVLVVFNTPITAVAVGVPFVAQLSGALREKGADGQPGAPSYSRITGLLGAVVTSTFFWALGNVVLWKAFSQAAEIGPLIRAVWPYFLIGSALFLPYAFNQLRSIFAPTLGGQSGQPNETAQDPPPPRPLAPGVVVPP